MIPTDPPGPPDRRDPSEAPEADAPPETSATPKIVRYRRGASRASGPRSAPNVDTEPPNELASAASTPVGPRPATAIDEATLTQDAESPLGSHRGPASESHPIEGGPPDGEAFDFDAIGRDAIGGDTFTDPLDDVLDDQPLVPEIADATVIRDHLRGLLEAILFVSVNPIPLNDLARTAQAERSEVKGILDELRTFYRPRGMRLDEVAGGWVFRTNPAYAPFVRDVADQKPVRLTRAQIETLAIVAYRQPITRPEIDDIRGTDSGPMLKALLERNLVKMLGKREEAGRPILYGTSPFFLEFFGLRSLRDLPTLREFTELTDESKRTYERKIGETPELTLPDPVPFVPPATPAPTASPATSTDASTSMLDNESTADDETTAWAIPGDIAAASSADEGLLASPGATTEDAENPPATDLSATPVSMVHETPAARVDADELDAAEAPIPDSDRPSASLDDDDVDSSVDADPAEEPDDARLQNPTDGAKQSEDGAAGNAPHPRPNAKDDNATSDADAVADTNAAGEEIPTPPPDEPYLAESTYTPRHYFREDTDDEDDVLTPLASTLSRALDIPDVLEEPPPHDPSSTEDSPDDDEEKDPSSR